MVLIQSPWWFLSPLSLSCDRGDYMRTLHRRSLTSADHDHLDRPCSILLASLSLVRRKTALTEKKGGDEFSSFIEGCHFVGFRTKMIVFRRSSLIPGDRDDHMRTPDRFQSLRSSTIVSVFANDRCNRNDQSDRIRSKKKKENFKPSPLKVVVGLSLVIWLGISIFWKRRYLREVVGRFDRILTSCIYLFYCRKMTGGMDGVRIKLAGFLVSLGSFHAAFSSPWPFRFS